MHIRQLEKPDIRKIAKHGLKGDLSPLIDLKNALLASFYRILFLTAYFA